MTRKETNSKKCQNKNIKIYFVLLNMFIISSKKNKKQKNVSITRANAPGLIGISINS